jgi:hypothetical protein
VSTQPARSNSSTVRTATATAVTTATEGWSIDALVEPPQREAGAEDQSYWIQTTVSNDKNLLRAQQKVVGMLRNPDETCTDNSRHYRIPPDVQSNVRPKPRTSALVKSRSRIRAPGSGCRASATSIIGCPPSGAEENPRPSAERAPAKLLVSLHIPRTTPGHSPVTGESVALHDCKLVDLDTGLVSWLTVCRFRAWDPEQQPSMRRHIRC